MAEYARLLVGCGIQRSGSLWLDTGAQCRVGLPGRGHIQSQCCPCTYLHEGSHPMAGCFVLQSWAKAVGVPGFLYFWPYWGLNVEYRSMAFARQALYCLSHRSQSSFEHRVQTGEVAGDSMRDIAPPLVATRHLFRWLICTT